MLKAIGIDVELDDIVDVNYTPQTIKSNQRPESDNFEPDKIKQNTTIDIPKETGIIIEEPTIINPPEIIRQQEETPIEQNSDPIPTETNKPQIPLLQ